MNLVVSQKFDMLLRALPLGLAMGWVWVEYLNIPNKYDPIWLWRGGQLNGGHYLDWLLILGVAIIAGFYPTLNGSRGYFVAGFVLSYHELGWNVAAIIWNVYFWVNHQALVPTFLPFAVIEVVYAVIFFWRKGWKLFDKRLFKVLMITYPLILAFWLIAGFQVTVYGGYTQWYSSLFINIAEISQWWLVGLLVLAAYVVAIRKGVSPVA